MFCTIVFMGCLTAAALSDIRTHLVADLIWYVSALDILTMMIFRGSGISPGNLMEALLVIIIQEQVMSRYYGRADSHAFSCCALYMAVVWDCLESHVLHMSLSLLLLTLVQLLKHNICRGMKLKEPAPFIPYILLGFMAVLAVHGLKFSD
ncbi:MAG: hypothetical protein K5871_08770 [Lachnospiraceae bacterium]|nr:hypothetical protein [Lachnospiraceae bacterium]